MSALENTNKRNFIAFIQKNIVAVAIGLSLFFHFASLLPKFDFKTSKYLLTESDKPRIIKLKLLKRSLSKRRQIVETENKGRKKIDDKSKFLSKDNQFFDRQSIAKNNGTFKEAGIGVKDGSKINSQAAPQPKKVSLKDLALGKTMTLPKRMPKKRKIAMAQKGLKNGSKNKKGLSQTMDFVEDVPLGDFTYLNSVRYKYYGFFHRIKKKIEQFWGSSIQEVATQMFKKGRRLPASTSFITSLQITMDAKGKIIKIDVDSGSGVSELDSVAVNSFNKAGPFPNPPKGMIKNGQAKINWTFKVDN